MSITTEPTTGSNTEALSKAGVSIWLDDLSRERIVTKNLQQLIDEKNVVGVTTNPTIFASALAKGETYDEQVRELKAKGADTAQAIFEITTKDVSDAADVFRGVYDATHGYDGRVSIEVSPELAHDTEATIAEAKRLWSTIEKPNVMIKIPATVEGLPAITAAIAAGISVNVTLIFSLERYKAVIAAYLEGLKQAKDAGIDLSTIHSVASFFVSRVDTEIDKRLDAIGTDDAKALKGRSAVANARLAYEVFVDAFGAEDAIELQEAGANRQRPLWASTGVKDPSLPDTFYVVDLVTHGVVNTMPEKTLDAVADHGDVQGDTIVGKYDEAREDLEKLKAVGVDLDEVTDLLEREGVDKFIVSWHELTDTVAKALESA
ncbi:transaldolase [Amnibacterium kyonggiense]|uniref:Transaldolase n=1 Tax=Amnibacterium kyonggiense TaxID=595671 RepID=A0A4R7FLW5_9MICO|nr:transaldolase [Amnibacterium kyonggiense]TDS77378.1 transaldolase [Amnibacterium kyonggiense]